MGNSGNKSRVSAHGEHGEGLVLGSARSTYLQHCLVLWVRYPGGDGESALEGLKVCQGAWHLGQPWNLDQEALSRGRLSRPSLGSRSRVAFLFEC